MLSGPAWALNLPTQDIATHSYLIPCGLCKQEMSAISRPPAGLSANQCPCKNAGGPPHERTWMARSGDTSTYAMITTNQRPKPEGTVS